MSRLTGNIGRGKNSSRIDRDTDSREELRSADMGAYVTFYLTDCLDLRRTFFAIRTRSEG